MSHNVPTRARTVSMLALVTALGCGSRTWLDVPQPHDIDGAGNRAPRGDAARRDATTESGPRQPDDDASATDDAGADSSAETDSDGARPKSLRFAVIGDYGLDSPSEAQVAMLVASWDPDFVITTGDNNYYLGAAETIDANIGQYYGRFIGNYAGAYGRGSSSNRFWPCPGNHDWETAALQPYKDYFPLPGNERYYDFTAGAVHFFALDSDAREPDGTTEDSVQARWLRGELARSGSCVNVVYFHHPAYSSGPHGSTLEMRWPFEAWGADVVLAGHDHVYERLAVGGIPHITVGLGGASRYDFVTVLPESRKRFAAEFGALRVVAGAGAMTFDFVTSENDTIDSFALKKNCLR